MTSRPDSPNGTTPPVVSLRQLTTAAAASIEHWFDHPEIHRRLGDRSWIHRELRLRLTDTHTGSTFRGMTTLRSHAWVALDQAQIPVAYIGGDVYDRWVRYLGEGPHGPLISEINSQPSMSLSYLVDPAHWRQGYGRATITAVLTHPDLTDVQAFYCGIDADNYASQRCATAAGFQLLNPTPDFEDTLYYGRTREPFHLN